MRLTLERIIISNFKGIRDMTINFGGKSHNIAGANGTGKTSIVDAFCWVLFNQNANGDAPGSDNFREKPLDENGHTIHNLDTTVELCCLLDGNRFDLKRTQTENWVKKRGNAEATLQGNVSTYWINGVETKKQDFEQRIKSIADGEIMRLIGSLGAFNRLEWKKRRAYLLDIAGDDIDAELLALDEYRPLADEIAQRNVAPDDMRKVLTDQKKAIAGELKLLPVRIDEAKKSIPEFKRNEIADAEYMVADAKKDLEKLDGMIIDAKAQSADSNRGELLALEQEIISIKRRLIDEHAAEKRRLTSDAEQASADFLRTSGLLAEARKDLEGDSGRLAQATAERDMLRDKYMERKRRPVNVDSICPTCGQQLPPDMVESTREKAEAEKREALMDIQAKGKAAAENVARYESYTAKERANIEGLEQRVQAAQTALEAANAAVRGYPAEPDFAGDNGLIDATARLKEAKAGQVINPDERVRALVERKDELVAIINRNMAILSRRDVGVEAEQRIKAYEGRQKELGAQLAETEALIMLHEQFVADRCESLEEAINCRFPTVRWKLFDTQINGGVTDACTAMLDCDGTYVPYESANTASQIAADIEIVDALSRHYDIRVPLFVDNAERVNRLPQIDTQTITLSVSTDDGLNIKEV